MTGDLPAVLAASVNRAVVWRGCPHSRRIPEGWVIRAPSQPLVHHVNSVRLAACPTATALEAVAERRQAGLPHRRVVVEDADGEVLAGELAARGWLRERVVLMALRPERAPSSRWPPDARAREVDEAALRTLERALFAEDAVGPRARAELPDQLSAAQAALRAATESRRFAAGERGDLAAAATLFMDPDVHGARVAQVESVGTLRDHREQGLATAAVRAALTAAREWGAELVAVVTDADDWPQVWYARLGFAPVARHVAYVRDGSGGGGQ